MSAASLLACLAPEEIIAKCLSSGLVVRRAPTYEITHPALALQATQIPAASFECVVALQRTWNTLVDRCARDATFLNEHLAETAASDSGFVGRLLDMFNDVYGGASTSHDPPPIQPLMLGIFRSDYMRDSRSVSAGSKQEWKNVEINTISVSFAALSSKVGELHEFFKLALAAEGAIGASEKRIVVSDSYSKVPHALQIAHQTFLARGFAKGAMGREALVPAVVFVVQENERNTGDQYLLAFRLLEAGGVRSIRRTLTQLHAELELVEAGAGGSQRPPTAVIGGKFIATVFYFRCSYVPSDFPTEECWTARRRVELSSAVKCPSLPYHLLTTKKLQQVLSDKTVLAKFLPDASAREALFQSFVGQHSLSRDCAEVDAVIADAIAHPKKYVLKPQLEGGGNLFAGQQMVLKLQATRESDPATFAKVRHEYILMERINYDVTSGAMLRFGEVVELKNNMCCELGIFGTIIADEAGELLNDDAGYVVRSKPADVDDGGVMAGVAALDCVELV
jgi:glutathione synthetase